jgi:hypothetical protein
LYICICKFTFIQKCFSHKTIFYNVNLVQSSSKSKRSIPSTDLLEEIEHEKRSDKQDRSSKRKKRNDLEVIVPELRDETGDKFNQLTVHYNELEQFFKVASSQTINENLLDVLCVQALETLYTITPKCHENDKLGELHTHFFDAKSNLHLRSDLKDFFRLIDPSKGTDWPVHFLNFLDKETASKISRSKSTKPKKGKKKKVNNGFGDDNEDQLSWAKRILARGAAARNDINNFLNQQWTTDYGSGGNEEGHLLMMRKHYHHNEFVKVTATTNVNAAARRAKKNAPGKSKYRVTSNSSQREIETEIERVQAEMIAKYDETWYPSCWLAFYLFGNPQHGTNTCFAILKSGIAVDNEVALEELDPENCRDHIASLNLDAASKSLRRSEQDKKGVGRQEKGKDVEDNSSQQEKRVSVVHSFVSETKGLTKMEKMEKALALLERGYLHSDEDDEESDKPKFSVTKEKRKVSRQMYQMLMEV